MGDEVIERSGMGDDLNFIPTNKHTLQSDDYENNREDNSYSA